MAGPATNTPLSFDRRTSLMLVAPAILLLAIFFLYPLSGLLGQSFLTPEFGFGNYIKALSSDLYMTILLRTLWFAFVVTICTLLLGYPVALTMSRLSGPAQLLMAVCVLVPLWTSVLVRSYAWLVLLQRNGIVNNTLHEMGLIDQPLRMVYTEGTVILATTHVLLPFMILSIFGTLRTIPKDFTMAAANLGASGLSTFRHVILPLSLPGVYSGIVMVFIISLGFYITPALLGGPQTLLMSTLIGQQTLETFDWGLAGALSVTLLVITLILVALFGRLLRLEGKEI
jgi:mannopine transport system permease protein